MSATGPWFCPTCGRSCETAFCPACGERKPHPDELTFKGLAKQAFDAFTSYDSRLWQTLRALMLQPGSLSLLYVHGSRKSYIGPFALFLLANVFFVGMEAIAPDSHVFAAPLQKHLFEQPWSFFAPELVAHRLQAVGLSMEAYAPLFDSAVATHARSLVILMVLPFALLPALLFRSGRLPFAAHLAFSLHFHAFLLTLVGCLMVIPFVDVLRGGPGLQSTLEDQGIAVGLLLFCAAYLYCAVGRVYGAGGLVRVAKSVVLVTVAMTIFLGYRFFLFILTLYTTGS